MNYSTNLDADRKVSVCMPGNEGENLISESSSKSRSEKSVIDPFSLVSRIKQRGPAPVHLWNPPFCGDMDMLIAKDGSWIHEGRPIRRQAMVNLFASILRLDDDQHYYLVTPVEKVRIKVEDCPFIVNQMDVNGSGREQVITITTNTWDIFVVDRKHAVSAKTDLEREAPHPTVHVRNGLKALINRSVFYRLVDLCVENGDHKGSLFGVWSYREFFELGG